MAGRVAYTGGIVRNGLVLHLDAAKRDSYPKTGTVWTDLSGGGNTGTLTNGPTYNSSNGGSIVFDGTNQYVDCGTNSVLDINQKQQTISCWFKTTQTNFGTYGTYLVSKIGTVRKWTYSLMMYTGGKIQFQRDDGTNNPMVTTVLSYNDGKWYNVTVTNDGTIRIYINGVFVVSGNDTIVNSTSNSNSLWIGSNGNNGGYTGAYFNGNISNVQVYNRALSATEVLQNYNALKGRYI
jgi:hypothetical protein